MNELGCSLDDARLFIQKSVKVAQQARKESGKTDVLIAGSVGPYGASLCDGSEFTGQYAANLSEEVDLKWIYFILKETIIKKTN
jgi:S-methylmethionine-dependent homocysteine/selenocysteine methylase